MRERDADSCELGELLIALLLRISSGDRVVVAPGADDATTFGTIPR